VVAALGTVVTVQVMSALSAPAGGGERIGEILVATLCALALLERWLMALPVRDSALWRWVMPAAPAEPDAAVRAPVTANRQGRPIWAGKISFSPNRRR
jgi:hypothetical protein